MCLCNVFYNACGVLHFGECCDCCDGLSVCMRLFKVRLCVFDCLLAIGLLDVTFWQDK